MTFWSKMWQLDAKIRRFVGIFIVTPFCLLALPGGLFVLCRSTADYLRLEQQHLSTTAVVQSASQTGGRHNRNAVMATFKAEDGKSYVSKALYGIEGSKHVRQGMLLGVIYERGNPSNNAPSLAYAQGQIRDVQIFLGIMAALATVLVLVFRYDYVALFRRIWRPGRTMPALG